MMYQTPTEVYYQLYVPQKVDIDGKSKVSLKRHNGSLTCKTQAKLSCVQGTGKLTLCFFCLCLNSLKTGLFLTPSSVFLNFLAIIIAK